MQGGRSSMKKRMTGLCIFCNALYAFCKPHPDILLACTHPSGPYKRHRVVLQISRIEILKHQRRFAHSHKSIHYSSVHLIQHTAPSHQTQQVGKRALFQDLLLWNTTQSFQLQDDLLWIYPEHNKLHNDKLKGFTRDTQSMKQILCKRWRYASENTVKSTSKFTPNNISVIINPVWPIRLKLALLTFFHGTQKEMLGILLETESLGHNRLSLKKNNVNIFSLVIHRNSLCYGIE